MNHRCWSSRHWSDLNQLRTGAERERDESKMQQRFAIAPVQLTLAGKNPELVGLGSYIVNAQASPQ